MRSMTAYARCSIDGDWGSAQWECRAINHRYLDVHLRLPESLRHLEFKLRERIRVLQRGKIECILTLDRSKHISSYPSIDQGRVEHLAKQISKVSQKLDVSTHIDLANLFARADIWIDEKVETAEYEASILSLFDQVISQTSASRQKEGNFLKNEMANRLEKILDIISIVKKHFPVVTSQWKQKLQSRLEEIKGELDSNRLEQEMIYIAQKMDIDEELDRLVAHVHEVQNVLNKEGEAVGRRLDFLMQELNREANTLSAKSGDIEITKSAVDLKVLIEQIREQVQNVI